MDNKQGIQMKIESDIEDQIVIVEFRDMKEKMALYTDIKDIEYQLKRLKSFIYSIRYYDNHNGKTVGVDLYFPKSARNMLLKVANTYQLPLC